MKFSLSDPKTRIQLLVLVVVLSGVGFYFYFYEPAVAARQAAQQKYDTVEQEIVYGRKRAASLQQYAQQVSDLKAEVDQVESRLAGGNRILLFLQALENGARQAGVKLSDLRPQNVKDLGETLEQPIQVRFTGSLQNTQRFIQIVEDLSYPSEVRQAQFQSSESGAVGEITTDLTVVMFSLKDGEA